VEVAARMTRLDRLNGVAHDLGHHAQSGLSWLYPSLARACQEADVHAASVDLLDPSPYPEGLPYHEPLAKALGAMREKLIGMLVKQGRTLGELTAARLEFGFPLNYGDGSLYSVVCMLEARGHRFTREFPSPN
jgi:hypothetical protein